MDSFMDKIAQKFGTQDVIRVNSEAEAKELADARAKISEYEDILSEIRRLNLKCVETNEITNQLVQTSVEKLEEYRVSTEGITGNVDLSEDIETIKNLLKDQEEFVHKENVRVYRNVQASLVEELKLQTEAIGEQNAELKKKVKGIKSLAITSLVFNILTFASVAACIVYYIVEKVL